MKKIIALLLSVLLLVSFSVTAFAAKSPVADDVFNVTIINGENAKPNVSNNDGTKNVTVEADPDKGDFDEWVIYKADGKTLAVEGVDYKIVKGSLKDEKLVILPLKGIIICGNYNGVTTKPIVVEPEADKDDSNKAPQTSDNVATALSVVMIAALGFAVVAKKRIAE